MKKILLVLALALFITSCASNRVCGGPGGARCVDVTVKPQPTHKANA
jgi:PBP1b-binding outer membrane lipoprotein LpoB